VSHQAVSLFQQELFHFEILPQSVKPERALSGVVVQLAPQYDGTTSHLRLPVITTLRPKSPCCLGEGDGAAVYTYKATGAIAKSAGEHPAEIALMSFRRPFF
jgi:hypothetical protein